MREALGEVERRKAQSTAAAWVEAECAKLISQCEKKEREIKFWQDHQRENATSTMNQAELKLE